MQSVFELLPLLLRQTPFLQTLSDVATNSIKSGVFHALVVVLLDGIVHDPNNNHCSDHMPFTHTSTSDGGSGT